MDPIIHIEDLVFQYRKEDSADVEFAVDHVTLQFTPGSFNAIIGRNGSGKSTLAKNINGLLIPTEELFTLRVGIRRTRIRFGRSDNRRAWFSKTPTINWYRPSWRMT